MAPPERSVNDNASNDRLRRWYLFRSSVLRELVAKGVDLELAEASVDAVRHVYLRCEGGGHRFAPTAQTVDQALKELSDWVSDFGTALLVEIVLLQIELRAAGLR